MENPQKLGFDDPARQENILNLMDMGFVVYVGEIAANQGVETEYFALVMRTDEHDELIEELNDELYNEFMDCCEQAYLHTTTVPEVEYQPLFRLTDNYVQWQPETRTSRTAHGALIAATLAIQEYERSQTVLVPKPDNYRQPKRLRQSRTHYRKQPSIDRRPSHAVPRPV